MPPAILALGSLLVAPAHAVTVRRMMHTKQLLAPQHTQQQAQFFMPPALSSMPGRQSRGSRHPCLECTQVQPFPRALLLLLEQQSYERI
eukprot:3732090-Amphidinium_carterae.1